MRNPGRWLFLLFFTVSLSALAQTPGLTLEQTIRTLYAPYAGDTDPVSFDAAGGQQIVSARMLAALQINNQLTPSGDVGAIDWDPLCACQDYENLQLRKTEIHSSGENTASATLSVAPFGQRDDSVNVELQFVREHNQWLIDDVIENEKSIYALVQENNQHVKEQLNALQRPDPEAFVREIYTSKTFDALSWPLLLTPAARAVYDEFSRITSDMSVKEQESKTMPDIWEATPLCGCVNPDVIQLVDVKKVDEIAGKTYVALHFTQADGKQGSRELILEQNAGQWQIDDFIIPDEGSLIQRLQRSIIAESAAKSRSKS